MPITKDILTPELIVFIEKQVAKPQPAGARYVIGDGREFTIPRSGWWLYACSAKLTAQSPAALPNQWGITFARNMSGNNNSTGANDWPWTVGANHHAVTWLSHGFEGKTITARVWADQPFVVEMMQFKAILLQPDDASSSPVSPDDD